jgi:hypothetical protein
MGRGCNAPAEGVRSLHALASAFALAVVLAAAAPGTALEKRAIRMNDLDARDWTVAGECQISYYNICTGWIWCWSGFGDDFKFGMVVENPCPSDHYLSEVTLFVCDSAPFYPGFTGTIAVHNVDENDCPVGIPLESKPFFRSIRETTFRRFLGEGASSPTNLPSLRPCPRETLRTRLSFATDRPAAGPSGPQACGACYPVNRTTRSFMYGPSLSPICPGSTFNDGVCDANLFWDIHFERAPTAVEQSSWGKIKTLYR